VIAIESVADLYRISLATKGMKPQVGRTHMLRVFANAICDALFEALQVLMNVSLLFQDQHFVSDRLLG
jgi:hypothetical protein